MSNWYGVVCGALLGLLFAVWTFGTDFFGGDVSYWNYLWGDAGSGLAAFRYYVNEPWSFPLLQANAINEPEGVNIAFTDSLPLLALVAKALKPLGIRAELWWSWWYLFIYAAQGAAAAYAVKSWGARSLLLQVSASVIVLSAPIFLLRTWHPGLAGQFTLLLAWAFVGKLREAKPPSSRVLAAGAVVALIAMLVHVYLLLGVMVILVGGVLNEVASGTLPWKRAAGWFAGLTTSVLALAAVCGYFSAGASQADGYFLVGMHLFGPVVPQRSTFWPGNEWTINASGSFEAFNWLGFGWIGVILLAAFAGRHRFAAFAKRYQVLLGALVILTLYSITPVIRLRDDNPHDLRTPLRWVYSDIGAHRYVYGAAGLLAVALVATYLTRRPTTGWRYGLLVLLAPATIWSLSMLSDPVLIDGVTGQFRAAGRLFWAVSYGALVLGLASLARANGRRAAVVLPGIAIALSVVQLVDVSAFRDQAGQTLDPTPERIERLDQIAGLVQGFEQIHLEPAFNCAVTLAGYDGIWAYQDIGIVASWDLQRIDAAYAARRPDEDCAQRPSLERGDGVVNVVVAAPDFIEQVPSDLGCRSVGLVVACSTKWAGG